MFKSAMPYQPKPTLGATFVAMQHILPANAAVRPPIFGFQTTPLMARRQLG
jgi:hypothetical protein